MKRARILWLGLFFTLEALGAEPLAVPSSEQLDEQMRGAYAVEQRARERPIRFEQECPPPETIDVFQTSTWNSVEMGVSFPLGDSFGEVRPYTRYTCPGPGVKVRR